MTLNKTKTTNVKIKALVIGNPPTKKISSALGEICSIYSRPPFRKEKGKKVFLY
jgi:hypothetical protein